MRILVTLIFTLLITTTGLADIAANSNLPSIAFYYGDHPPIDSLKAFNWVVVNSSPQFNPQHYNTAQSQAFAYVSIGEVKTDNNTYKQIDKSWVIGSNPAWQSAVMDISNPAWQKFIIEKEITPLWQQGYRGFFFDTLDSYESVIKDPKQQAAMAAGEIALIQHIKAQYPDAKIILNRGFNIIPKVHSLITADAAESLFYTWNPSTHVYGTVPEQNRNWLLQDLNKIKSYGVPVIVIDYLAPKDRELARHDAAQIKALGFIPYVTNDDLTELGISTIEVIPRTILIVYQYPNLYETAGLLFASLPLNYLGYTLNYQNIDDPLPTETLVGRYAGIVVWPDSEKNRHIDEFYSWVMRQVQDHMPIAFFDYLGFSLDNKYLVPLGLYNVPLARANANVSPNKPFSFVKLKTQSPLFGFEIYPYPDASNFSPIKLTQGQSLLQISSEDGSVEDAAGITPWGGYVLSPFTVKQLPNEQTRWVVNPFKFLTTALRLSPIPAPDTTTENGRRFMIVHVDGDGFISRAEWDTTQLAGNEMYKQIFERYRVPSTVSVIVGEISADGVAPQLSNMAMAAARQIFALPWVEIGSHTFSHPFQWGKLETQAALPASAFRFRTQAPGEQYNLKIPNYQFSINTEITGSIDFINKYLAPAGKRCKVMLWSGDSQISPKVLSLAYQDQVANMNGGNTTISIEQPSLANVSPVGIPRGDHFQLFAPNQNDNVYTNLWHGPFYGYAKVIQTFILTNTPLRLKPIDIYYHFFSATKLASISALETVYNWALSQPVVNIYVSDYFYKVLDFNSIVLARSGDAWIIDNDGALRELRTPQSMGIPDLAKSQNIIGYSPYGQDYYIHLGPATQTVLYFEKASSPNDDTSANDNDFFNLLINLPCRPQLRLLAGNLIDICSSPTNKQPYLLDANGRVTAFTKTAQGFDFRIQSYMPLDFSLTNMQRCELWQGNKILVGSYVKPGVDHYTLSTTDSLMLQVKCAA